MRWRLFFQIVILLLVAGAIFYFVGELELGERPLEPRIATHTPEETVRSYIRIMEHTDNKLKEFYTTNIVKYFSQIFTEEQFKLFEDVIAKEVEGLLRDPRIDSVRQESDYRVVIFFSELLSLELGRRVKKFVLARSNGDWKIDQILESCFLCKGTGRREILDKLCETCKGTGWTEEAF